MCRKQKKYFICFKLIIYRPYFRKHNWSEHTNEGEMELVVANIKMKLRKDHNIVVKWIGSSVKIRLIMRSEWRPYKLLTNFQWRCSNLSYPISRFALIRMLFLTIGIQWRNIITDTAAEDMKINDQHCEW